MKTFLTLILAAVCVLGHAQKKPKINQALAAMESGELAEAKSIIDAAIEHEKTMNDPKTWYYRGQIYAALDTANNEPGALDESLKSFDKALELDPEQKSFNSLDVATGQVTNIDSKRRGYYAFYYNMAIDDYGAEAYEKAADNFETAYYIMPSDTNAILNAAYSAGSAGDAKRAEENFIRCYEAGMKEKTIYLQLYNFANQEDRLEDALSYIQKGKEMNPGDMDFAKYEINLLMRLERTDEAMSELETSIKAEPNNADLIFSLGVLRDEMGDTEAAIETYNQAISVDPDHYNSIFNKGVILFNKANELIKEKNALSYKEEAKSKELTKQINVQLETALPTWEKLYSLDNTDQSVLETLAYIYSSLRMNDKYNKIQDELDALGN